MALVLLVPLAAAAQQPPPPSPYAPPGTTTPVAGYPPPGYAPPPPMAPPPPPPEKHLGLGYKIGNGLGFVGADLIISPISHLGLDLQFNYLSFSTTSGTATGYGLAPAIQGRLYDGQVSTPYAAVGLLYAKMDLDNVTASAGGYFLNVGYEWRWAAGLGIILGGGVGHLGTVHATNGIDTIDQEGGTHFNLETGVRFMFL